MKYSSGVLGHKRGRMLLLCPLSTKQKTNVWIKECCILHERPNLDAAGQCFKGAKNSVAQRPFFHYKAKK